jgi:Fe-S cluster assembly iron-binding protein IscA
MFQVTHAAALKVADVRRSQGVPDAAGLRVFEQARSNGERSFGLAFSEAPAQGDEISEQEGTRVFLAAEVAVPLADSALDVESTPEGSQLVLTRQDPGTIT